MPDYWRLSATLTVTVAAGRAIFLDVARDRYAMLPRAQSAAFVAWLNAPEAALASDCAAALDRQLGLAGDDPLAPEPVMVAIPAQVPGPMLPRVRTRWRQAVAVAWHVLQARRRLAREPLALNLVRRRRALEAAGAARPIDRVPLKAAVYQQLRPFAPVPRVCLLDSLALIDWLGRDVAGVALVFGVTAYPFGAHCWVQAGDRLLGDDPDWVGRYAPILHLSA